jgi:hypothetical protein
LGKRIEIATIDVNRQIGLTPNRFYDARVSVPKGSNRDPGTEVEEHVSIDIFHPHTFGLNPHEWCGAGQRWRSYPMISLNESPRFWAWRFHHNFWTFQLLTVPTGSCIVFSADKDFGVLNGKSTLSDFKFFTYTLLYISQSI